MTGYDDSDTEELTIEEAAERAADRAATKNQVGPGPTSTSTSGRPNEVQPTFTAEVQPHLRRRQLWRSYPRRRNSR